VRWLVDEMFPPALAQELRKLGHDADDVRERDLARTLDSKIYSVAVEEERVVVTENFADFAALLTSSVAAGERGIPVACVRKGKFPRGAAMAAHVGERLHEWAVANPDPYPGLHWP
jgi:hypothetical protein